jgi:hypothetical protein
MPSASMCVDTYWVNVCQPNGQWGGISFCEFGCTNDVCRQCSIGTTQCVNPMQSQLCGNNGVWGPVYSCPGGCFNGRCEGNCTPGAAECTFNGGRRTCLPNGVWSPEMKCDLGCSDGACLECNPFQSVCFTAKSVRMCEFDGKWGQIIQCQKECSFDARCTDCQPGTTECLDDKHSRYCNDTGTWEPTQECDGLCFNDACRSCKPGQVQCASGDAVQICGSEGDWGDWITCANACKNGACVSNPKQVFVTSTSYKGGELGGLAGADAKCQARAVAGGLKGTFRVWLSDFVDSPSTRFTKDGGPYVLVGGATVANNWTGLTQGSLRHAININELGGPASTTPSPVCNYPLVWTNTNADGTIGDFGATCGDWTDPSGFNSWWGTSASQSEWTSVCSGGGGSPMTGCSALAPIYCFEQ